MPRPNFDLDGGLTDHREVGTPVEVEEPSMPYDPWHLDMLSDEVRARLEAFRASPDVLERDLERMKRLSAQAIINGSGFVEIMKAKRADKEKRKNDKLREASRWMGERGT